MIRYPEYNAESFVCPNCGVFSSQTWSNNVHCHYQERMPNGREQAASFQLPRIAIAQCHHCRRFSYWHVNVKNGGATMFYPTSASVTLPDENMPEDVKVDFLEAREIVNQSPRGAAALLRLGLQKLCVHLGEPGKNINEDIKSLVVKGLHPSMQQAADSLRIIGNNAVHPGELDLKDDRETAYQLFNFLNILCDLAITQPKRIRDLWENKVPEKSRDHVASRDGKPPGK